MRAKNSATSSWQYYINRVPVAMCGAAVTNQTIFHVTDSNPPAALGDVALAFGSRTVETFADHALDLPPILRRHVRCPW
jgi:hypothetical protein